MARRKTEINITQEMPFFMSNDAWYYHDENEWKYKLTKTAPKEAIESYKEYYRLLSVQEVELPK